MTCDIASGTADMANNNNVTTNGTIPKDDYKMNGHKTNGTAVPIAELEEDVETRKSMIILLSIFVTSIFAMFYIYKNFPELEE